MVTTESPPSWQDDLINNQWSFGMAGIAPSTTQFLFSADGKIAGYSHRNEQSWRVEDNVLKIYDVEGQLTWLFRPQERDGEIVFVGEYQRNGTNRPEQLLKRFTAQSGAYKIANLGEIQRQLGETRVKLLHRRPSMPFQAKACSGDNSLLFSAGAPADQRNILERMEIPGAELWELHDVAIYSRHGIIIVDNFIVDESLLHFPKHFFPALQWIKNEAVFTKFEISCHKSVAYHGTGGNLENYFHFFFELVSKFCSIFTAFIEDADPITAVVPSLKTAYQAEMLEIACQMSGRTFESITLQPDQAISTGTLYFPRPCPASSLYPNDLTAVFVADFKHSVEVKFGPLSLTAYRKIYISRRDTNNRVIENERNIEEILQTHGFEILVLTNMRLLEQILLFNEAKMIVAPHGAGLTNIVFCQPGATVIELHMEDNLNWVYRRMSQVLGLNYDYSIGKTSSTGENMTVHGRRYNVDISAVLKLVLATSATA